MPPKKKPTKNLAAAALSKLGASKGGKARAAKLTASARAKIASIAGKASARSLSPEQRSENARKAAAARWK